MATDASTTVFQESALSLIRGAMRLINVLGAGEEPEAGEAADALTVLNELIDTWSADRMTIFMIQRLLFVPLVLKQAYTVGPGGDFNIPRPPKIERLGILSLNNPYQPLELPMKQLTYAGWSAIPVKQIYSSLPLQYWDDNGFPLRTLWMYPIPNAQVNYAIYAWAPLGAFINLTAPFAFPPGYAEAIKYNLAVRLASEFGVATVPPVVIAIAQQGYGRLALMNALAYDLQCDDAIVGSGQGGAYNWRSDTYSGRGNNG